MSKLQLIRAHGYDVTLLPDGEIEFELPTEQEQTPALMNRLRDLRPTLLKELQDEQKVAYRYMGYSTRRDSRGKGRLVLEFVSDDTGEITSAFFNANITYQRGPKTGEYFPTGRNERFWVWPNSKFARFWTQTIGQPAKCSTLYRQMGHLKPFRFHGEIKIAETYQQINNLKKAQL